MITNNGIGIKNEDQINLFKLFGNRLSHDASTKLILNDSTQIGLGMIVSKQIIEALGGQLDFSSQFQVGSSFVFSFQMEAIFDQ